MTRHRLELEENYDFLLLGICSQARNYKLCWAINTTFDFKLKKEEADLEVVRNLKKINFPFYSYYNEEDHSTYSLISNKYDNSTLIPEQKQTDFFLVVQNSFDDSTSDMLGKLRALDCVLTAFDVDVKSLRSKQNLLF